MQPLEVNCRIYPIFFLPEEQQKQLQSSVNLLSPAGEDLAEIKQQEQQIVNLLNEQRRQENELQRLHVLQQRRLEEQSNSFTHERKVCTIPDCRGLVPNRPFSHSNKQWRRVEVRVDKNTANV